MSVITNTELVKQLADRCSREPIAMVSRDLKVAEVYILQILDDKRPISRPLAQRLGYSMVSQPKPERLFQPIEKKKQIPALTNNLQ